MTFQFGDKVKWINIGVRHSWALQKRIGYIVLVIPKGLTPLELIEQGSDELIKSLPWSPTEDTITPRKTESYVVIVTDHQGRQSLYWPKSHLLERVLGNKRGRRKKEVNDEQCSASYCKDNQ